VFKRASIWNPVMISFSKNLFMDEWKLFCFEFPGLLLAYYTRKLFWWRVSGNRYSLGNVWMCITSCQEVFTLKYTILIHQLLTYAICIVHMYIKYSHTSLLAVFFVAIFLQISQKLSCGTTIYYKAGEQFIFCGISP